MNIWRNFAYIFQNKIINITCYLYTDSNESSNHAKQYMFDTGLCESIDNDAFAVEVTYYPVSIGDSYIDGIFYRDNEIIYPVPTEEERLFYIESQMMNTQSGLIETDEKTTINTNNITDIEIAITEIYENLLSRGDVNG